MPGESAFTLENLEKILGRMISSNENRKREYTRWTAAGIAATVTLVGIFLERLGHTALGFNPTLSVLVILIFAYVLTRIAWELLEGNILSALRVTLASEEARRRPWDDIKDLFLIAEVRLTARRIVFSPIAMGLFVTVVIFGIAPLVWDQAFAKYLLYLALWRLGIFVIFVLSFRALRRLGLTLLPEKEKVKRAMPTQFSEDQLRRGRLGSGLVMLSITVYYLVQLWLLWVVIQSALPLTYEVLQLFLLAIGLIAMLTWIRAVTWPIVEVYSAGLRKLQNLHTRVVSGELRDPIQIQSELAALMREHDSVD